MYIESLKDLSFVFNFTFHFKKCNEHVQYLATVDPGLRHSGMTLRVTL
ncbi:hypothetical protein Epro_0236 [Endomicrobium proavitum]|uniref:Uncharacterized protein n=1 Tax=Endomicrobium proavitum TaxID=1408281 RepID=A0A0G3WIA5_9BACT|nr:hypothetical protein Epro_0236 [Endomicrobium proavitum]